MFETIQPAAPDAILGLNEEFLRDARPHKVNLTVGVYKDESGVTPILSSVKAAEQRLCETEATKAYLGIAGLPEFTTRVRSLLLGDESQAIGEDRAVTVQCPGGTGALRVAADFLARNVGHPTVWCSRPTWANHHNVFRAAGLPTETYAYLDAAGTGFDAEAMMESLKTIPAGDVVCLHGCCHNPTGVDPSPEDWCEIVSIAQQRGWLPLVDLAYQGFGSGLDDDARAVRMLADAGLELMVAHSYSKNFGLYAERTGALTVIVGDSDRASAVESQVKSAVRANYSNPPKHGAAIVATILSDDELTASWMGELAQMRERIHALRQQLADGLTAKGLDRDFSFLLRQNGMFSFSGLTPLQVDELKQKHAIYMVRSGRINIAGLNQRNLRVVCDAIADVIRGGS